MRDIVLTVSSACVAASLYFSGAQYPRAGRSFAAAAVVGFLTVGVSEGVHRVQHRRDFARRWAKLSPAEQFGIVALQQQDGPLSDGELSHILGRNPVENLLTSAYKKTRLLMKHDYQGSYEVDPEWQKYIRRKSRSVLMSPSTQAGPLKR